MSQDITVPVSDLLCAICSGDGCPDCSGTGYDIENIRAILKLAQPRSIIKLT